MFFSWSECVRDVCVFRSAPPANAFLSMGGRPPKRGRRVERPNCVMCPLLGPALQRLTKLTRCSPAPGTRGFDHVSTCHEKNRRMYNRGMRACVEFGDTRTHTRLVLPLFLLQLHACILCAHACTASRFSSNSVRPLQQRQPRLHLHMHAIWRGSR